LKTCLGLIPLLSFAQRSHEEGIEFIESKLLNVLSAPYRLKAASDGSGYKFCNNSAVTIVRFRLGCVQKKKDEVITAQQWPFVEHPLPAGRERL
jgi:hypothetical protein